MTTAVTEPAIDQEKAMQFAGRVVNDMGGALTATLGYIGDLLGLFRAMEGSVRLSSAELASRTNLNERYVREWLRAMTAAEYVEYDSAEDRYWMTPEQALVLTNEDSPMFAGGGLQSVVPTIEQAPRVVDAFRRGGGIPYGEMHGHVHCGIERTFRPGYVNFLTSHWLPSIPGLVEKLQGGARAADIGCGRGQSTVRMAKAFPASSFTGVDYHGDSIGAAMKLANDEGVANIRFVQASAEAIASMGPFDLVTSFDCIHDMTDPAGTLRTIRAAMADDADYLWSEPNASHDPVQNRNPIGRFMHSISPLHCLTVSLAHGGAGLGTVIGEKGARELAAAAGFSTFERLPIDDPFNQFFWLRK
jgi:2-polyprenyl-3-methyl-5-hydroxy-6-metoxy-1,4-benzoquinol methylase